MFSRSDKPADPSDELYDAQPKQRNPMVLATLAGLLAIVGAFLLIRYLSDSADTVTDSAAVEATRQVLVVTQPIPAGTDVADILATPASYLSARAVPEQFAASSAVSSVEELRELDGLTLSSDALAGEQLLRGRFIDRSDFGGDGLIDRASDIRVPDGHHTVVVPLATDQALGGNFAGGEQVSVVSAFRVDPPEGDPFEVSVVVLPAVEVIAVQTTAEFVGAIDDDRLGSATVGELFITLAVEPDELTKLTYSMKYGDIILAGALEDGHRDDPRPITIIDNIIAGAVFTDSESLAELLGFDLLRDEPIEDANGDSNDTDSSNDTDGNSSTDEGAEAPAPSPSGVSTVEQDAGEAPEGIYPEPPPNAFDESTSTESGETEDEANSDDALSSGN